ncbi:MAG: cytochrome bc1 complex diheme cytochrome c subunit [Acidimicrobiales bacterium]
MRNRLALIPVAVMAFVGAVGATYLASSPEGGAVASAQVPGSTATTVTVDHSAKQVSTGRGLFIENCSTCHGVDAQGSSRAPNLVGLGAATVDFWLATGRMPLAYPTPQAQSKPPLFDASQRHAIVSYVTSLGAGGPGIPNLNLGGANVATGQNLFSLNCAGCHTITGSGDALANGYYAPSLLAATAPEIAEAMRTGPGNMPRFGVHQLSPQQVDDVVAYVRQYIQHPVDRGGLGLGHVGPVAEGFVGLILGVGVLCLAAYWIGEKAGSEESKGEAGHA